MPLFHPVPGSTITPWILLFGRAGEVTDGEAWQRLLTGGKCWIQAEPWERAMHGPG